MVTGIVGFAVYAFGSATGDEDNRSIVILIKGGLQTFVIEIHRCFAYRCLRDGGPIGVSVCFPFSGSVVVLVEVDEARIDFIPGFLQGFL